MATKDPKASAPDSDSDDSENFKAFEGKKGADSSDDEDDIGLGSSPGGVLKEGWAKKKSGRWGFWQKRYLVLKAPGKLFYYKKPKSKKPQGVINLDGTQVVEGKKGQWQVKSYHRGFKFNVKDEKDKKDWVELVSQYSGTPQLGRRSRTGSSSIAKRARVLVSRKKRRFQEDDFDLDLAYITPRILAMGFPSDRLEKLYRNPRREVIRFLDHYHPGHYAVVNLCVERDYPDSKFDAPVMRFPFADHNAPTLEQMVEFCEAADKYLAADPKNTFAVHCKAGKGRTGVMICAWLLHTGLCATAEEALDQFARARTYNGKGVTIPSQRRYIGYYEHIVKSGPRPKPAWTIKSIIFHGTPKTGPGGGSRPWIRVNCNGSKVKEVKADAIKKGTASTEVGIMADVQDQVNILCFENSWKKKKKLFYLWFQTSFVPENGRLILEQNQLDKAIKDKKNKFFPKGFKIELVLTPRLG